MAPSHQACSMGAGEASLSIRELNTWSSASGRSSVLLHIRDQKLLARIGAGGRAAQTPSSCHTDAEGPATLFHYRCVAAHLQCGGH